MSSELLTLLNTLVLVLMGGGGIWLWRAERRVRVATAAKEESTAAKTITEAAANLLKPLQDRIGALETEVKELRAEVAEYVKREQHLEEIINQKNARIEALEAELDGAHRDRDCLHEEVNKLVERLAKAGINGDHDRPKIIGTKLGN